MVTFRSSFGDPNALFLGLKAGSNQINHGHLDAGTFEFHALGVPWAIDLGSDNYNLPGYWDKRPGGQRWTYYRLNSRSHNVPLIENQNQKVTASCPVIGCELNTDTPHVTVDLTSAYSEYAEKVIRSISLVKNRTAALITDSFHLKEPSALTWGLTTRAEVNITALRTAILTRSGRKLIASIIQPASAKFTTKSAQQESPQNPNKGVTRLTIDLPATKTHTDITVLLSPVLADGSFVKPDAL